MDFEYCFKHTDQDVLRMEVMPNDKIKGDLNILSEWLISDVSTGSFVMPKMENVITKLKRKEKILGNAFIAKVKKDYTIIKWSILDIPNYCKIPTEMLYEILKIWVERFTDDWNRKNK